MTRILKLAALIYFAQAIFGIVIGTVATWSTEEGKHAVALLRAAIGI